MKALIKILNNLHNFFQICLISLNLIVIISSIINPDLILYREYTFKDINLFMIKLIQIEQIVDILLNILKGNSFTSSLAQVLGRNIVSIYILDNETNNFGFLIVLIAWNLGDLIRYLFYSVKNDLFTFMRFNGFIILYPIGIIGELICIEDKKNRSNVNGNYFRCLQTINTLGVIYLYMQLWNKSKKNLNIKKD
jgi:very-long-chain (3R)-3-hydroxyacyl-CoA dehydratase